MSPAASAVGSYSPDPGRDRRERDVERTPGNGHPRARRASQAPSERSVKSAKSGKGVGVANPGVIRLYSTFNDATSLCESPLILASCR